MAVDPDLLTENLFYGKIMAESTPLPMPIVEQPKRDSLVGKSSASESSGEGSLFKGLSSLAVANSITIVIDKKCCGCDWDVHYNVINTEHDTVMFRATEDHHWCYTGNIRNVIVRDHNKTAVARVCYKEKSCCSNNLVLAIYAPPDLLVGSVEESLSCFLSKVEFKIRNADGNALFSISYHQGTCLHFLKCGSYFTVKSGDGSTEVAKILEKTNDALRLQFKTKLDITGKIILTGFCIGLVHKTYNQSLSDDSESSK